MSEMTPERAATLAAQEAALRRFTWLIAGTGVALLAGSVWLAGLDFGVGVLLGFGIVLLNFIWTKKAVKSVLFAERPRGLLTLSFLVKFGLTGAVLFYAILRLNVDAVGVLVGLSSLLVASVLFTLGPGRNRR
jgi:ATP synthase I chain